MSRILRNTLAAVSITLTLAGCQDATRPLKALVRAPLFIEAVEDLRVNRVARSEAALVFRTLR